MPPNQMDPECVAICAAINKIKGLRTTESCCGHGKSAFLVFFQVQDPEGLPPLLYYLDPCHVGFRWWCKVKTDCSMAPASYYIESVSKGPDAYKEATVIAERIGEYLKDEERSKGE